MWPNVGFAADPNVLIGEGIKQRELGHDEEALGLFREAYQLAPTPRARAQIAFAEQALGQWTRAETDLLAALEAAQDTWVNRHKVQLEAALATIRAHLGSIEVRGGPEGADLSVDGSPMGKLPRTEPMRAEAGSHTLEVHAAGHYPFARVVLVYPEQTARVQIAMQTVPASDGNVALVPLSRAREEDPGRTQRIVGNAMMIGSLGVVTGATLALLARGNEVGAYNADPACPGFEAPSQSDACALRIRDSKTWGTLAIVGFSLGGALLLGGFVVRFTAPSPRPSGFACTPSAFGLTCGASF